MIIQEVQIMCLIFLYYMSSVTQSVTESTNRTEIIFIITPKTPI